MNKVGQGDQFARGIRSHVDVRKVLGGRALVVTGLQDDVVLLAVLDVGRDPLLAHHRRQRPADVLDRDAKRSRAVLVDSHHGLGLGLLQVAVDALQAREFARPLEDEVPPFGEGLVVGTAEHELNGPASAHAGQARTHERECAYVGHIPPRRVHARRGVTGADLALAPRLQDDHDHAAVGRVAAPPGNGHHDDLREALVDHLPGRNLEFQGFTLHALDAHALRPREHRHERALVFLRDVLPRHRLEQEIGGTQRADRNQHRHPAVSDEYAQDADVAASKPGEAAVDPPRQPVLAARCAQELGTHHRGQ